MMIKQGEMTILPESHKVSGSSMYGLQKSGPIEDYVLADLYAWLEAHSGFTRIPDIMSSSNSSSSTSTTK
jgi:hypothetical protein